MPQAESNRKSWLKRLNEWIHRERSYEVEEITAIVYLPKEAVLMNGALRMGMPPDFVLLKRGNATGETVFLGRKTGLVLTVSRMSFRGHLREMAQEQFQTAFFKQMAAAEILSFRHDYVRHSPRLTVHYRLVHEKGKERCAVVLVQRNEKVYSLLFTGEVEAHLPVVETMIETMET